MRQLFLKTALSFEAIADQIGAISLPGFQRELRDGLNLGGGDYYKFWDGDTEVLLVANDAEHAEVFVPSRSLWKYYCYVWRGGDTVLHGMHAALSNGGVTCELADDEA